MTADPLTIAYMAIGAHEVLRSSGRTLLVSKVLDDAGGELGFIETVIGYAAEVDELGLIFEKHGYDFGVFVYEVAEPIGAAIAQRMLTRSNIRTTEFILDFLREVDARNRSLRS